MTVKSKNGPQEYELASFGQRFAAIFIDGIILMIPTIIVAMMFSRFDGLSNAATFGLGVFYSWYFWTQKDGQTPGKSAMKIRVIKADGTPITNVDALIRYLGYTVSSVIFCLGYLWMLWDSEGQTWHDKMAKTYVVKVESDAKTVYV